jgi:tripartite-type tricarboxylate transporter receptor subunit TctC
MLFGRKTDRLEREENDVIRPTRRTVIAGGLSLLALASARANTNWPDRPITIIHGFPPGGPTDLVARIVADGLTRRLGQRVLVEGKPGASGTTAAAQVARAAPDGYTLFAVPSGHAFAAATYKTLPYRTVDDFSMISMFTEYPYLMATYADHSIRTVADLIRLARTRNAPLLYGSPGNGSGPHLAVELFAKEASINLQHVPYRGSAPAAIDLIAERLDFMMDPPAALLQFVRDGKLRPLAVTGERRFFALPDVPTVAESGLPGYVVTAWQGLLAPAGLPAPILDRLNAEVVAILKEPEVAERLRAIGNEPKPTTSQEFKARMEADIAKWTALVESANFERI